MNRVRRASRKHPKNGQNSCDPLGSRTPLSWPAYGRNLVEFVALSAGGELHDPAPGCRLALPNIEGIPGGVGNNGYSWAASANDINGMLCEFRMQFLIPNYAVSRSYGFQLRCLSE